jgi:hypothetical protein
MTLQVFVDDNGSPDIEPRQRYEIEEVARVVQRMLPLVSEDQRKKGRELLDAIRRHRWSYFWARPSTRIVDAVCGKSGSIDRDDVPW